MWHAYYQADGEVRHTIAISRFEGACQQALEDFVNRMTHPEVGLWWVWVTWEDESGPADIHVDCDCSTSDYRV